MANDNNSFFFVPPFIFDEIQGNDHGGDYGGPIISDELDEMIKPNNKDHSFGGIILDDHDDDDQYGLFYDQHNMTMMMMAEKEVLEPAIFSQQDHNHQQKQQELPNKSADYSIFDDFDAISMNFNDHNTNKMVEACKKQVPSTTTPPPPPFASLELLSQYESGLNKLSRNKNMKIIGNTESSNSQMSSSSSHYTTRRSKLSTEDIMRIAGSCYIRFSSVPGTNDIVLMHPFGSYALSGLSQGETKDVQLVHLLLSVAEKVEDQQFDRATRLLQSPQLTTTYYSSSKANSVERVVLSFAEALREKIDSETGFITRRKRRSMDRTTSNNNKDVKVEISLGLNTNILSVTCFQRLPFPQVLHFPAIQAIIESLDEFVDTKNKLHVIDLEIRSGVQWTLLMEALAERNNKNGHQDRPLFQLLKITAIGTPDNQIKIEETQNRLKNLAESLNIPFLFKPLIVSDMNDINEGMIETEEEETLAVFSSLLLRMMLYNPCSLEKLMRVIKTLQPSIMVVVEIEANLNSPSFANRFIEALFFYGAFFDCFATSLKEDEEFKTTMEEVLGMGIENIVSKENGERVIRSVRIGVWRAFFERFRMVESKLSESSVYQASLVAKNFGCGSSLTMERNGKGLIVGWKGTPINSLSVWKFGRDRGSRSWSSSRSTSEHI
ncbi:DELLA protein RGL3-like [Humulus lupulus]|uniref:DELLA protein RGL3-like n=1 Tax=Humulus lupulus TaxID=3486 RepID=UPI002B4013F1|nr:DELLA protein RGL3-like [Humulus lupulus]